MLQRSDGAIGPKSGCRISFAVHPLSSEELRAFRRMQGEELEGRIRVGVRIRPLLV